MSEQGLLQGDSLEQDYQKVSTEYGKVHGELKSVEAELKDLNLQLKLLGQYYSTRKEWKNYNKNGRTEEYYLDHKTAIDLHEKVLGQLKAMYDEKKFPDVKALKEKKRELLIQRKNIVTADKELGSSFEQIKALLQVQQEASGKNWQSNIQEKKETQIYK